MIRVLIVRLKIKEEALQEFATARNRLLAVLEQEKPKGIRYTWCKGAEETSFTGLLELGDDIENPLPGVAAGKEFLAGLQRWVAAPPVREELTVLGTYSAQVKG